MVALLESVFDVEMICALLGEVKVSLTLRRRKKMGRCICCTSINQERKS